MKKILCIAALLLILPMVLGCDDNYTEIYIYPSSESNAVRIDLPGHDLDKSSPYEIIYTDDGCDVIIHFIKNKES